VDKIFVGYTVCGLLGADYKAFELDSDGLEKALAFEEVQRNKGYKTDFLVASLVCDNRIKLLLAEKAK